MVESVDWGGGRVVSGCTVGGARVGGAGRLLQNGDQGTKVGGNKREQLQILASRLAAVFFARASGTEWYSSD